MDKDLKINATNAQRAKERNDRKMIYEGNENTKGMRIPIKIVKKKNGAKRNSRALK